MGSKAILPLCLLAVVLMIASDVTARDLAESTNAAEKSTNGLEESKYPGGGYPGGGYPGGGNGGYPGGGRGGRGGNCNRYCRYGCCCRNYYRGRDCRCCSYAGLVVDNAKPETKPKN